jgi:hypothetical protein
MELAQAPQLPRPPACSQEPGQGSTESTPEFNRSRVALGPRPLEGCPHVGGFTVEPGQQT